jgi:hypothetical protein
MWGFLLRSQNNRLMFDGDLGTMLRIVFEPLDITNS